MAHHVLKLKKICESCKGTGIYKGMAERDRFGVVCHTCKGTGCHIQTVEYDDFESRVSRNDVDRVLQVNPGICVGNGDGYRDTDFGGVPYDEWLKTGEFPDGSEMRRYTCPAWWYQSANYAKKPHWKECAVLGSFSSCSLFGQKHFCWMRFDHENKQD